MTGDPRDNDWLIEAAAAARFVLLGEASHGTHEFYRQRASITRRLIEEKGFSAVAIEGDWPDADRVNRFVRGRSRDAEAVEALDAVLHLDRTRAVEPLEINSEWSREEVPETCPSAL